MNIRWRNKVKIATALLCLLGLVACGGSTRSMNLGDTIYGIRKNRGQTTVFCFD